MPPQKYLITKDENGNYVIASPITSKKDPNSYTLKKICTLTSPSKNCSPVLKNFNVKQSTKDQYTFSYILNAIVLVCLFCLFCFTIHLFCKRKQYLSGQLNDSSSSSSLWNNWARGREEPDLLFDDYK
jgi:hypothetical protein